MSLESKTLVFHETAITAKYRREEGDIDADWISYDFTAWAICGNAPCRERVALAGGGSLELVNSSGEEGQDDWREYFVPRYWQPMPELIEIPEGCPSNVREELNAAFSLHAIQRAACAGRLRVALEFLMDHLGIPRKSKSGRRFFDLPLHTRLERCAKICPGIDDHLTALKRLGNAGSHGSKITQKDVLDAFEVFEHTLSEIIEKRSQRLSNISKGLSKKFSSRSKPQNRFKRFI